MPRELPPPAALPADSCSASELADELVLIVVDVEQLRQCCQVKHSFDRPV
jgi:hypothetical protein